MANVATAPTSLIYTSVDIVITLVEEVVMLKVESEASLLH